MTDTTQIILYGTDWCGGSRRARLFFDQHNIPYRWVNIDEDDAAARYVQSLNKGNRSVPTIVWPDGSRLVEPSTVALAQKLGVPLE
jgi:glutaredoxin-like protein